MMPKGETNRQAYSNVYYFPSWSPFFNDYDQWLEKIAPHAPIKRQIMGREVVVAVTEGRLDFALGSRSSTESSTDGGGIDIASCGPPDTQTAQTISGRQARRVLRN